MSKPTDLSQRYTLSVYTGDSSHTDSMAIEVREGLTSTPKRLSPRFFYDAVGSELFEQITELPEYYPTRAERELLLEVSDGVLRSVHPAQIVELGSGSSSKTKVILGTKSAPEHVRMYVPFDVSRSIVEQAAQQLIIEFPYLSIHGVIGDFNLHLPRIPEAHGVRLVLFLGGTIGNFAPEEREAFLRNVAAVLGPEDRLLIGLDLLKDVGTLEAAYNDSQGVTAEFNRNVLRVLNRELGADFNLGAYRHDARFNQRHSRIEMHLVAQTDQVVHLPYLGLTLALEAGETIWTESSYKFTESGVQDMLNSSGYRLDRFFTNDDPATLFGLALASPMD